MSATYAQMHEAAQDLLGQWFAQSQFVAVDHGRLDPCDMPPDGLPYWRTASEEAAQLLVTSVLLGHRYHGWDRALARAQTARETA